MKVGIAYPPSIASVMVNWNYRVFQEANGDYFIREVFYAEDGSIIGCTENAVEPYGQPILDFGFWIWDWLRLQMAKLVIRKNFWLLPLERGGLKPLLFGQSLEELAKDLKWFQEALALPVLKLAEIPHSGMKKKNRRSPKDNISHEQLMAELGLGQPSATG